MLLIHSELCFRANMSVDWTRTSKVPYLEALTLEIENPHAGHLDTYLRPFIEPKIQRQKWLQSVVALPGLDGVSAQPDASAQYADPSVAENYRAFERRRGYKLARSDADSTTDDVA